jgi:hypothetical protein
MKNDAIGNRTRDLPRRRAVPPQLRHLVPLLTSTTATPRTPVEIKQRIHIHASSQRRRYKDQDHTRRPTRMIAWH